MMTINIVTLDLSEEWGL